MFGLGRKDKTQVAAVDAFRDSLVELRGGFVFPLDRGEQPVLLTEVQRDVLVCLYADHLSRAMWWMMILTLGGVIAIVTVVVIRDMEVQFWMVAPVLAIAMVPALTIRRSLRREIEGWGLLPRVPSDEYAILRRERLRAAPWSSILLPALVLPFFAMSQDLHFPPADADDWVVGAFLLALGAVFVWAIARKLLAGRTADL